MRKIHLKKIKTFFKSVGAAVVQKCGRNWFGAFRSLDGVKFFGKSINRVGVENWWAGQKNWHFKKFCVPKILLSNR